MNKSAKIIMAITLFVLDIIIILLSSLIIMDNRIFELKIWLIIFLMISTPFCTATLLLISSVDRKEDKKRIVNILLKILLVIYSVFLLYVLLFSHSRYIFFVLGFSFENMFKHIQYNANVIPFKTLSEQIINYVSGQSNKSIIIENILGNMLLFAPMGILLPSLFKKIRLQNKFISVILLIIVSIELIQLLTNSGIFDIDDIILNLLGALVFYNIWKLESVKKILIRIYVIY